MRFAPSPKSMVAFVTPMLTCLRTRCVRRLPVANEMRLTAYLLPFPGRRHALPVVSQGSQLQSSRLQGSRLQSLLRWQQRLGVRHAMLCATLICLMLAGGCQHFGKSSKANKSDSFGKLNPFRGIGKPDTVGEFAIALEKSDRPAMAQLTSSRFQSTALRDPDAVSDVKRMWPVKGELEVVKVKEVDKDDWQSPNVPEKLVTVQDERKWKTDQRLIRDPKSRKWVIDEIFISQEKKGLKATKTISEQVVFLSSVRDFAVAWQSGNRKSRLDGTTAACRKELEPLPDEVLNALAVRMFPPEKKSTAPEATMDDDIAVARLRRPTGALLVQMKRINGTWLIDDAALDGGKEGDHIPSLRKTAVAYATAAEFLNAYNSGDRDRLKAVAGQRFYSETLKSASLLTVPLPPAETGKEGQLKVIGRTAELVLNEPGRTVRLTMSRTDDEQDVNSITEFRVEDVTLFENEGRQKRRLASVLIAEPLMELYAESLVGRNLHRLRALSSHDFNERVWQQVSPEMLPSLPLREIRPGGREILSTTYNGPVTEITVLQDGVAMTYILKEEAGAVRMDDVLVAVADRPSSLKTTVSHLLPALRFVAALDAGNLDALRTESTNDFNRLIWSQVRTVPPTAQATLRFLQTPVTALEVKQGETFVRTGTDDYGSLVYLIEQQGRYRVHDVTIVAGRGATDHAALKPMLRDQMANGTLFANAASGTPHVAAKPVQEPSQADENAVPAVVGASISMAATARSPESGKWNTGFADTGLPATPALVAGQPNAAEINSKAIDSRAIDSGTINSRAINSGAAGSTAPAVKVTFDALSAKSEPGFAAGPPVIAENMAPPVTPEAPAVPGQPRLSGIQPVSYEVPAIDKPTSGRPKPRAVMQPGAEPRPLPDSGPLTTGSETRHEPKPLAPSPPLPRNSEPGPDDSPLSPPKKMPPPPAANVGASAT